MHQPPAAIRPSPRALGRLRLSALSAVAFLSFGWAAPLGAQTLDYVDHISVDFAHDTVLNTNISLYYHDAFGNLQAPPTEADNPHFYLFSTKGMSFLSYNSAGPIPREGTDSFGWVPIIPFRSSLNLGSGSEVSYTPIQTVHIGPNISDNYVEELATTTGARNILYDYNLVSQLRWDLTTLSTDPSEPLYRPGNALLATGFYTSLVTSNGGIYTMDLRNRDLTTGAVVVTPLLTAQGSGPGELSNPTAMAVGPDGLLYVLDYGNNRIQKFDLTTGEYRGQFALPAGVTIFSTSLAISADGHIYLGDGLGGGSVLDLAGNLLGTFHPPAPDASWVDGGLISGSSAGVGSFLQYDGLGNIFTYVEGQGITMYRDPSFAAVPEPSTWALLGLGLTALLYRYRARDFVSHDPEREKGTGIGH